MRMTVSSRLAPLAVAALLSVPAVAWAQSAVERGAAASPPAAAAAPVAGHEATGKSAQERVEKRIKELHTQLRITSAEQPQWEQFAQVMRENARDMDQVLMERAQQFPTMNAVQNMQSYQQITEEHTKRLEKLVPAFEKLYQAMPDQQKQLADQVFRANAQKHARQGARAGGNG